MKKFRKNKQNLFVCEECERTFKAYQGLRTHIRHSHKNLSQKNYYDKHLKEVSDDKCKICNNETLFIGLYDGYKNCCSKECSNKYRFIKSKEQVYKLYNVENQFQRTEIKNKCKQAHLRILGVEYPRQSQEIIDKTKRICLEKYGDENYTNTEKRKETCLEKYGYDTVLRDSVKMRAAIMKKYGVENVMHYPEIFQKQQMSAFKAKTYKNTTIYYRGSYELDFLEKYYNKYSDIKNGPSIKYKYKLKNRIYHTDFYIPSKNLIVEIKSSYYYNKYKEMCITKETAVIKSGYKYLLILDKNYVNDQVRCLSL